VKINQLNFYGTVSTLLTATDSASTEN